MSDQTPIYQSIPVGRNMVTSIYQSIPVDVLKEGTKQNVDRSSVCMKYEFFRLSSFASFPQKSGGRSLKLAKAGFLFTPLQPDDDTVTCFSCQVTRNNWTRFEDPMEIHKSLNPECEFIKGNSENVEIPVPKDDVYLKIKMTLREMYSNENNEENSRPQTERLVQLPNTITRSPDILQPTRDPTFYSFLSSRSDPIITHTDRRPQLQTDGATDPPDRSEMLINESTNNASLVLAAYRNTMVREEARLRTFTHWPRNLVIRPPELARAGFYYLGSADQVQCAFCKGILRDWDEAESPVAKHWRYFSNCRFMTGQDDRNIPLIPGDIFIADNVTDHPQESNSRKPNNNGNLSLDDRMNLVIVREALDFGLEKSKVRRVVEMKSPDSGPFFTTSEEIINAVLDLESDSSRESKVEKIPEAPGSQPTSVSTRESEHVGGNQDVQPEVENQSMTKLKRENEELKERRLCKICMDAEACVVFLPCGHFAACASCGFCFTKCPLCRQDMLGTVKTLM